MTWPTQQQQGQPPQGQWPSGQQTMGQQPAYEYSLDHLPQSPQQQQQQQRPQQQPQGQPPVSGYWPQPQQPQQQAPQQPPQQQWPAQTQQQPQGPQRVNLDANTILDGPNVPNELRGRTWGEAQRLYSALATNWMQQQPRPQQQPQQSPAERWAQSQQSQAAQQPQGQQAPSGQPGQFWQNPEARVAEIVGQVIDQRVMPALQPITQQTQAQAVAQARHIASQAVPDFDQLEMDVVQILASQNNPEALRDPQVWQAASDLARGRRMAAGQYQPPQPPRQDPRQPRQFQGNGQQPGQQRPPAYSFFTEQPTAPSMGGTPGAQQPTQAEYEAAQKWNMPVQEFMAWKYGNQAMPAVPAGGY